MNEYYPDIQLQFNGDSAWNAWQLIHEETPTLDEEFAIAQDIKAHTGLISCTLSPTVGMELKEFAYIPTEGDIDNDGIIDSSDAMLALEAYTTISILGQTSALNNTQQRAADMDEDGIITTADAIAILTLYAESLI